MLHLLRKSYRHHKKHTHLSFTNVSCFFWAKGHLRMKTRPPKWRAGARLQGGLGLCCFPRLVSWAPGTEVGRPDAFSILCALSFRRTVSNYNGIIFLWSQTSAEENMFRYFTTGGAPVFVVILIFFGKLPFLMWFSVLESPPLEQSPGTRSSSWSWSLRACLHYMGCAVCAQAQTTLYRQSGLHWFTPHISRFIVSVVF